MQKQLTHWLIQKGVEYPELVALIGVLCLIAVISLVIHIILHHVVLNALEKYLSERDMHLDSDLVHRAFERIVSTLQGLIVFLQAQLWLTNGTDIQEILQFCSVLWMMFLGTLSVFTLLDLVRDGLRDSQFIRNFPLRGILQGIKLVISLIMGILVISMLIGKSPFFILSGLGAMTAVLLLVFKDPILGFASGIQLSANRMLSVGDWLDMPAFNANGNVIDIGLTTVKVRNWDNTITTVPTYALISNAFKNWRGMTESGGRRIQRSVFIDINSVRFLSDEDIARLQNIQLLKPFFDTRLKAIAKYNQQYSAEALSYAANGQRLTNLGVFRAYLVAYLNARSDIHKGMTLIVRQMDPTPNGAPLEIYAFTSITEWVTYEAIQSEIFEHVFAVMHEFGLRVHQYAGDAGAG